MKNVTLSIPDDLLEKSRAYAAKHGTSLNEFIRDLLRRNVITTKKSLAEDLLELSENISIDSKGWKWNREEANER